MGVAQKLFQNTKIIIASVVYSRTLSESILFLTLKRIQLWCLKARNLCISLGICSCEVYRIKINIFMHFNVRRLLANIMRAWIVLDSSSNSVFHLFVTSLWFYTFSSCIIFCWLSFCYQIYLPSTRDLNVFYELEGSFLGNISDLKNALAQSLRISLTIIPVAKSKIEIFVPSPAEFMGF